MPLHLIIDGYNLIRQSAHLSELDRRDLEQGRKALLDALAAYRRIRRHRITVVFDAADASSSFPRRDRRRGVDVRFSACGESADDMIRRMAAADGAGALVVSSDRAVADAAARRGAAVIAAPEFEQRLYLALAVGAEDAGSGESEGWVPTTRKKGPRRRLPKRQRRQQSRLRKI